MNQSALHVPPSGSATSIRAGTVRNRRRANFTRRLVAAAVLLAGTAPVAELSASEPYPTPAIAANAKYLKDFGARCDGSTDDRDAIQRGLNAIRRGGQLVLPAGRTCVTKGHLKLVNGRNWTIIGRDATIMMDPSIPGRGKRPPNWILWTYNNRNFAIYDLTLDGNRQRRLMPPPKSGQQNSAENLKIWRGKKFKIVRTRFINSAQDGVSVGADGPNPTDRSTASRNGVFHDIVAKNNWRVGIHISNAINVVIEDSVIHSTKGDWPQSGIDIEANRTYSPSSNRIIIRRNSIYGNDGWGLQISGKGNPRNIVVKDNYFAQNARGAIKAHAKKLVIARNLFENFVRTLNEEYYGSRTVKTEGIIFMAGGAAQGVVIENNAFESIHAGRAILFVRGNSGSGHRFVGNCIHDVSVDEMHDPRGRVDVVSNEFRDDGCPKPTR